MPAPDPATVPDAGPIVVSNREPYVHETPESVTRPAGGLSAALDATMQATGGTWIAWGSGAADFTVAPDGRLAVPPSAPRYQLTRLAIDDDDLAGYYYGYSNQLLWPLAHRFISRATAPTGSYDAYRRVNEQFADAVVTALSAVPPAQPTVWFHDYHLMLAPRLVREQTTASVDLTHFWHIPWPTADTMTRAPGARALIEGLLANDRLGFHLESYRDGFLETVRRLCPAATVTDSAVEYERHRTEVYVQPIGVDDAEITETAATDAARQFWADTVADYGIADDETVLVSVDRLDYTKGILKRLDAIETLLRRRPDLHGQVRFIQKGTLTRSAIPAYERYQQRVRTRVATLNYRFGQSDWEPIVYIEDDIDRAGVLGLFAGADVGVVTPIIDGFNLAALEYVLAAAARGTGGDLVLSHFCGAAAYLEGAVTVNPHDTDQFATALEQTVDGQQTDWMSLVETARALSIDDWIAAGLPPDAR